MIHSLLGQFAPMLLGDATGATFWMPEAASSFAGEVDWVLEFINITCYIFFALIVGILVWFAIRYRRDPSEKKVSAEGPTHGMTLELVWTIIPTGLVVVMFWIGMVGYINLRESPDDSYEVSVTAQMWNWSFNHPEFGFTQVNELHVPLNRPVRLIMGSSDVLHSLFVPAFRVKQDVVPGRYSMLWFEATKVGSYQLYCAEYCGTEHSQMLAIVHVLPEDEFQDVMGKFAREYEDMPDSDLPAYAITRLYNRCESCHSLDGSMKTGPSFKGLWDRTRSGDIAFTNGKTLKDYQGPGGEYEVPENFIRDSILNPGKLVRQDYANVMPANFASQLKPRQIEALVLMMKNLDSLVGTVVDDQGNTIEQPPKTAEDGDDATTSDGEGG